MALYFNILPYDLQVELLYYFNYDEAIEWFSDSKRRQLFLQNYLLFPQYWIKRLSFVDIHVTDDQFEEMCQKLRHDEIISGRNRDIKASDVYFYYYTLENYHDGAEDYHSLLICVRNLGKRRHFDLAQKFLDKYRPPSYDCQFDNEYWIEFMIGLAISCKQPKHSNHSDNRRESEEFRKLADDLHITNHLCTHHLHNNALRFIEAMIDHDTTEVVKNSNLMMNFTILDHERVLYSLRRLIRSDQITSDVLAEIDKITDEGHLSYLLKHAAYINSKELILKITDKFPKNKYSDRNMHYCILEGAVEGNHCGLVRRSLMLIRDKELLYDILINFVIKHNRLEMLEEFMYEVSFKTLSNRHSLDYYAKTHAVKYFVKKYKKFLDASESTVTLLNSLVAFWMALMGLIVLYKFLKKHEQQVNKVLTYTVLSSIFAIALYISIK